jgi:tetratricopeptide (TPR) repeat protein
VFLLGELGQVEGAVEVAGLVLDDESKRKLTKIWASKRLFDRALKVAEGIEKAWERAWALAAIAKGMAKAGMFDQALKVAEGIEDAWERAEALREIAEGMAKAGMIDWAKEVFEQTLKVAEGIEWAWEWASALREIAVEMAKAGVMERAKEVFDQALKVAEGIEWASERSNALRAIAERMVRAGEVEGAVGIVEREMAVRTKGLPSVLKALAERAKQGDEKSKKEGFLRLLPLCGWSLEFAYKACGLLAWLYPERGEEIAGVIAATGD